MSISEWFSDDEVLSQLRGFFELEEIDRIDSSVFSTVAPVDGGFKLVYSGRVFLIEERTGVVSEVFE